MKFSLVCVALLLAGPAFGASFVCGEASRPREKLICADQTLSDQDSKLAQLYSEAQKNLSEAGRQQVIIDQRGWLHFLTQVCPIFDNAKGQEQKATIDCLGRAYFDRIKDLGETGVRIGPFVFTRSVRYQAIIPPQLNEQDRDGFAGRGISTRQTAIPKIDSPQTSVADHWNAMNAKRLNGDDGDCGDDGDHTLSGDVAFANARLISVTWVDWFYCHGAPHGYGNQSADTLVLSPAPHALRSTDLFRPDGRWSERLTSLLSAAIYKAYVDEYKEEPKILDQKAIASAARDTKHWVITADGLRVLFSNYELGAGYGFAPTVVIPWSKLKDQMVQSPPVF